MYSYETRYYVIHTDLQSDDAREAGIRMTKMAEEYYARTRDFSGAIRKRMPFFLYKNADDFYATGAPKTSAGYFNGEELVALDQDMGPRTWHTVQHEGFHQFAHFMIGGRRPVWVNEGLAEYFGEALFTGDGFVSGAIPQWRLTRIRQTLAAGKFKPLSDMMQLSLEEWNSNLAVVNYDQGWSMVQFLAHGDNEKYQRAFGTFMVQLGKNKPWQDAWREGFGETQGFEQKWRDYWKNLPDNPTIDLYAKANVATLTSFLGRAVAQRQSFADLAAFEDAAGKGQLAHPEDWLPPALLSDAMQSMRELRQLGCSYQLLPKLDQHQAALVCTLPDSRRVQGRFTLRNGRVAAVNVGIAPSPKPSSSHR